MLSNKTYHKLLCFILQCYEYNLLFFKANLKLNFTDKLKFYFVTYSKIPVNEIYLVLVVYLQIISSICKLISP